MRGFFLSENRKGSRDDVFLFQGERNFFGGGLDEFGDEGGEGGRKKGGGLGEEKRTEPDRMRFVQDFIAGVFCSRFSSAPTPPPGVLTAEVSRGGGFPSEKENEGK